MVDFVLLRPALPHEICRLIIASLLDLRLKIMKMLSPLDIQPSLHRYLQFKKHTLLILFLHSYRILSSYAKTALLMITCPNIAMLLGSVAVSGPRGNAKIAPIMTQQEC